MAGAEFKEHRRRRVVEWAAERYPQISVSRRLGKAEIAIDDLEERVSFDQLLLGFYIAVYDTVFAV